MEQKTYIFWYKLTTITKSYIVCFQVEWEEPASFWLGPRAADLIHLGAKFAPCMRRDARIARAIAASARRERDTACCIRNDDSGCVQSSKADCSVRTYKEFLISFSNVSSLY